MQQDTDNHQLPPVEMQDQLPQDQPVSSIAKPIPVSTTPIDEPQSAPAQTAAPVQVATAAQDFPDAEDVDLIEKAWVEKAKAIVKSTMGDPYTQTQELSKVKSAYIKKRYNKETTIEGQEN